jgi:uncharacterized protein (TIGR03032 family)
MSEIAKEAAAYADRVLHGSKADPAFVALLNRLEISLLAVIRPGAAVAFGAIGSALTISCTPIADPMGLAFDGQRLAIGGRRDITVFAPSTRLGEHLPGKEGWHDVVFVPVTLHRTGECTIHEMSFDGTSLVFVNTLFSCIARAEGTQSFMPLWRPSFISKLMPEDRCHLNSFAIEDKRLRYVTAFAETDTFQGFRERPIDAGVIIDVERNSVAVTGLVKPHSVRLFDGQLYVLNSGAGEVLRIDPEARTSTKLAALPGFTRGLRRHGDVLFVGLSTLRATAVALDLPLSGRADSLVAGIAALDLATGQLLGMLRFAPGVEELFDFVVMPGVRRALVFDPVLDAPITAIETPEGSFLMATRRGPESPKSPGSSDAPPPSRSKRKRAPKP